MRTKLAFCGSPQYIGARGHRHPTLWTHAMPAECAAWLNGHYLPLSQASLSIFDAGVTSGASATERLRTFRHEPFLLEEHLDRLVASAEAAFVPLPMPRDALSDLLREVIRRNAQLVPAKHDLSVSAFVTAGIDGEPTLCVYATAIPAHFYVTDYDDGIALATPGTRAMAGETLSPHIKTRNRLHWHIADAQASRSAGAKAILLDSGGRLTETATGNLFVFDGAELLTPRRDRTLRGISQAYTMDLARGIGFTCREQDLRPIDLTSAREAFLTSSIYCVLPVVSFNGSRIDDGRPGPVHRRLLAAWSNAAGVDIVEQMNRMARGERGA